MPDVIRETDEYVRYDMSFDDIIDAAEQVEAAAEGYTDLDTRLDGMDNEIDQAKQAIHFKGFVDYYADLPNDAEENDAYTVLYSGSSGTDPDGTEYVYSNYGSELSWNPWGKQTYSQSQIDTFLSAKQDTVTAGTGLAFGTGEDANTLGHSNSVTAKATQGFAQIAYDAQGHITGSTAATTAQVNAINSGIDSTKVAQIETNKNNILLTYNQNGKTFNYIDSTKFSGGSGGTVSTSGDDIIVTGQYAWAKGTQKINAPSGKYRIKYNVKAITSPLGSVTIYQDNTGLYTQTFSSTGNFTSGEINITGEIAVALTVNQSSSSLSESKTLTISELALIPKSAYDAGFTDYQPYALPNTTLTPALVECVDKGSKNIANIPDSTITGSSYVFDNVACNIPVGSYVFSYTSNQSQSGNVEFIVKNSGGTTIFSKTVTSQSGRVAIPFTIAETGAKLTLYSVRAGTYSNFMICTEAEYKASQTYQPYAMSNVELTEEVTTLNQASQYNMAGAYNSETGRTTFAALYRLALETLGLDTSVLHHYIVHVYTNTVSPTADLLIMYGTYYHNNSVSHAVLYNSQISYYADNMQGTLVVSGGDNTIHASVRFLD